MLQKKSYIAWLQRQTLTTLQNVCNAFELQPKDCKVDCRAILEKTIAESKMLDVMKVFAPFHKRTQSLLNNPNMRTTDFCVAHVDATSGWKEEFLIEYKIKRIEEFWLIDRNMQDAVGLAGDKFGIDIISQEVEDADEQCEVDNAANEAVYLADYEDDNYIRGTYTLKEMGYAKGYDFDLYDFAYISENAFQYPKAGEEIKSELIDSLREETYSFV